MVVVDGINRWVTDTSERKNGWKEVTEGARDGTSREV
jgi:hypothetical protein